MSHAATKVHQRKTYVSLNSGPYYEGGLCQFRGVAFYSIGDRRFLGPSSWSRYLRSPALLSPTLALLLCMCFWKHPGEGASWKTVVSSPTVGGGGRLPCTFRAWG